jgi:hypothetical protein
MHQNVGAGAQMTRGGPGAAPSRGGTWWLRCCPEPWGHMVAPVLPRAAGHLVALELSRAGSGSQSRGDTWRPQSCPQPGGGSYCLDLVLVCGCNTHFFVNNNILSK